MAEPDFFEVENKIKDRENLLKALAYLIEEVEHSSELRDYSVNID